MLAASFNTMPLTRRLRDKANFTQIEAEETATAIAESVDEWQGTMPFATREDAQAMRDAMHSLHDEVRAVDLKIEKLEARIAESKADLMKWMFGQTLAIIGVLVAILRIFGH